jgi:sterol desaturase/sphingolipid hydroxylase (fatty acid hydroxylase superfamily)
MQALPELIQKIVAILIFNSGELLIFGLLMFALQAFIPLDRQQKRWDHSSNIDLAYSFILALSTPFFYLVPIGISDWLIQLTPLLRSWSTNYAAQWPWALNLFVGVFLIDFVSYWRHRMMHLKWLWPIHLIHHSSTRLNWLSTERFHILNYVISTTINTIAVVLFLGAEVALYASFLRRLYNFYIHSNVKISYGLLGYFFVSPKFHHWHHSVEKQAANKNYCTFFSCIDWVFGTFYLPSNSAFPDKLGSNGSPEENLWQQTTYPFKQWWAWIVQAKV